MQKYLQTYLLIIVLLCLTNCKFDKEPDLIHTADQLLWENPDSCIAYIQAHKNELSTSDTTRLELIYQHALFKISDTYHNDTILRHLADHFQSIADYRFAAEAWYIQGSNHVQQGQNIEATLALKEAENLFKKCQHTNPILLGMLYMNLGVASERSRYLDVANEYYRMALPYFKIYKAPIYLYTIYHFIGKTSIDNENSALYLDTATQYAHIANDKFCTTEIAIVKALALPPVSNYTQQDLISDILYLCDSCHQYYYVAPLVKILIEQKNFPLAESFLSVLANDTLSDVWYREQYHSLSAELAYQSGKTEKAYQTLKHLHEKQTKDIEVAANAGAYIISQKYDAAKEQELRLQETVRKQKAYIGFFVVALLCIVLGGYTLYANKRNKFKLLIQKERQKRLTQELETHRTILKTRINERLNVARELRHWQSHQDKSSLPDAINILSPGQATWDQNNWMIFYTDFNLCYNNMLARLEKQYPDLILSDLQYIALTFLQFDTTDICFLLDVSNRTIWNRKNTVKRHLGMAEDFDLDVWIRELQ